MNQRKSGTCKSCSGLSVICSAVELYSDPLNDTYDECVGNCVGLREKFQHIKSEGGYDVRFCLYDEQKASVLSVMDKLGDAIKKMVQERAKTSVRIYPLLTREEYEAYPQSFRGVVNGRYYLLYSLNEDMESTYDQVIID